MPQAIWKGAIGFGLVHVPVALYAASTETGIDFDWLDKRSMAPVGYKRVNKKTGKEVAKEHIVRGVKVDGDRYVVLSDAEIRAAYPRTTQTIEIQSFVHATEVPFTQLEKPYFLAPVARGEKVYALLREAMAQRQVIGIARVVLHTKEHLAALVPVGAGLMLNTLRWADEIRSWSGIELPPAGRAGLKAAEIEMATQLVASMTRPWKPDAHEDRFTKAIHALVARRARAGATEKVEALEEPAEAAPDNVVDLTLLLKQSLGRKSTVSARTGRRRRARARPRRSGAGTSRSS